MRLYRLYNWTMIVYMLLIYAFYPTFNLKMNATPITLYQYLTESFLSGHTYLSIQPSSELLHLADPYDPNLNKPFRFHDASLFQGNYYLYFGPLPVVLFYLPIKFLTGLYPSDGLVLFIFLSLTLLVGFSLLNKIKERHFPSLSQGYLFLAGLLLSVGNGVTILLSYPRVYEVAIASAFCFMTFAFYFLYQILSRPYKTKDVFLFSCCLSLTVAGRPHFALVCLVLIPNLGVFLYRNAAKDRRLSLLSALVFPAVFIAVLLAGYNYLRFGSIFDFGHLWQLSCNNIKSLYEELQDYGKIPRNLWYSFYFYFLQPFTVSLKVPFFGLKFHHCTYSIDNDYFLESVGGVLITTPLILFVLALPKMLKLYFIEKKQNALAWFVLFASFVPFLNAFFLLMLPFSIQRYEVDFLPYLVFLAIISFWMVDDYFRLRFLRIIFIAASILSIVLGFCFAWTYWVFS